MADATRRALFHIDHDTRWFPQGLREVVAHADGRHVTLGVRRKQATSTSFVLQDFACADHDACRRAMEGWLATLATLLNSGEVDPRAEAWAREIAAHVASRLP
ncbi:MAG TPA: hypothetical protein VFL14_08930 [Xanthomonadales bacterium]|nr:hypothetical protein [Xanthomonadales bacterium]